MRLLRSVRLPVPAAAAFAWHERPGAFERLAPPWERIEVVRRAGGVRDGARVELRASAGPFRTRWVVEHRDYVAGRQFRDVQLRGPFARWTHLHAVGPAPGDPRACVLTDTVDYALPLPPFGAIFAGAFVRAQLDRLFTYRHAVTVADIERHQQFAGRAPLTVAVTGATGLIGSALVAFLTTGGHTVRRVRRGEVDTRAGDIAWDPNAGRLDPRALEGVDAVVHLAGESVADRWTSARKREIRESRVKGTRLLAETIARLERRPGVFVSASATGYYGDRGDEVLDESAAPGRGFLADVVQAWEGAADPARAAGIRVAHPRFGIVLSPKGGMLQKLLPPFKLGLGGKVGAGRQWTSWVALDDAVGALHYLLMTESARGPANVTAPNPVTNADFSDALGRALHRPVVATIPEFAVKLVLGGEQAEEMVFASQRAVPRALEASGFRFRHPTVEEALRFELGESQNKRQ